jgi:hypothetical protein
MAENLKEFSARMKQLGAGQLFRQMAKEMRIVGLNAVRYGKVHATFYPRRRSGNLVNSIASKVTMGTGTIKVTVSAGGIGGRGRVPYAAIQEYGGKVDAPSGKYLRIPLSPARTKGGQDRYPGPLRSVAPDLFRAVKAKDGDLFLFKRGGIDLGPPWYKLVKSVKIKPKFYLTRAVDRAVAGAPRLLGDLVAREIIGPDI